MMNNILKSLTLAPLSFLIVAYGSSSSVGTSGSGSSSDISVSSKKATLTASKTDMDIDFILTNNYSSKVGVTIKDFSLAIPSCEIEGNPTFSPSSVTFDKRSNVKIRAKVKFSEECTPTGYQLHGKTLLVLGEKKREMDLNSGYSELNVTVEAPTSGTGGTSGTPNVAPIVVIPNSLKEIKITTNSKSIEIPIKVFNEQSPYAKGSVKVELPSKVLSGADVGLFDAYEVPVNSQGIATFNYTGPSNLQALLKSNDLSSTFRFYHTANSKDKEELKVMYEVKEDTYVPVDYSLGITTQDDDFSMGIPNKQRTFTVNLLNSDGNIIENKDVKFTKIEVSIENALVAQLLDEKTTERTNSLVLENINSSTFILNSKKLSGIEPIRVTVEFIDINKKVKKLSTIVNVRVMSGPASAISISYVGTNLDASRAKYEEQIAVSVTDEYGNKVNTRPYISLGALVGYAVDGSSSTGKESYETKRLYYGKNDIESGAANGTLDPLDDDISNTTNFEDNSDARSEVFKYVNAEGKNSDKLVVFGQGKNYEAMGKWDFSKTDNKTLKLADDYFGKIRDGLSYAIGRNYYQDQCYDDGREWIGSTDSETYQLDEEGTVVVSYKYDYHLTGKDALIWVNLSGYQSDTEKNTRIGEVSKHTLRGRGLESIPTAGYSIPKGTTRTAYFDIHHKEAPEWYKNGHFGYAINSSCASYSIIDTSNTYDARRCYNSGVAYVSYSVTAPADKACTFNIVNVTVADEF